jgi:1-acyl-sn-glycerol-3-phosphate acyltransferase
MQFALGTERGRHVIALWYLRVLSVLYLLWLHGYIFIAYDVFLPFIIYNPLLLLLLGAGWKLARRSESIPWVQAIRQVRSAVRAHGLRLWVEALVTWAETIGGLELVVTGDDMRSDESCIVLVNHRSWVDSLVVFCLAVSAGRAGDFRFLGKRSLAYLPIIGLAAKLTGGVLFISRNYARDEAKMRRTYRQLTHRRSPFWFTIFPEGTRLNAEEKLKQAREYYHRIQSEHSAAGAESSSDVNTGVETPAPTQTDHPAPGPLVEPQYCLVPRVKGFRQAVQGLRPALGAIYDCTIFYESLRSSGPMRGTEWKPRPTPADLFLKASRFARRRRFRVHVHVRRTPIDQVPTDDLSIAEWMFQNFAEKERLLGRAFAERGFIGERASAYRPASWIQLVTALGKITGLEVFLWWVLVHIWKRLLS